jgi:hypothetical protein
MKLFLAFPKIAGYTGYKSYNVGEALTDKVLQAVTRVKKIRLQQVTTGYRCCLYYLCNLCNLCEIKKVTNSDAAQALDLQGVWAFVTRVTCVTRLKSQSCNINFFYKAADQFSKVFLRCHARIFCFRSYDPIVTAFFTFSFLCAPLCKTR